MNKEYIRFVDSHTHLVGYGIEKLNLSLYDIKSKEELYFKLEEYISNKERKYVIGYGWDESRWKDKNYPLKEDIDRINNSIPVILRRICGHIAVCNSKALDMIHNIYWKDERTGLIFEEAVLYINEIFKPDFNVIKEAIKIGQKELKRMGIFGISDMMNPEYFKAYYEFDKEDELEIYVSAFIFDKDIEAIKGLKDGKKLKLRGIKVFMDGSIGARTAAIEKFRYLDSEGKGLLLKDSEYVEKIIRFAEDNGLQVAIHCIGDRAIEEALKGFRKFDKKNILRHRIEHFELATDEQINEAIERNIILSMQPNFIGNWSKKDGLYGIAFGKDYILNNRIGLILKKGGFVAFGSDGMPYSPEYGIKSVVESTLPEQRISYEEAIRCYTFNSAYASSIEKEIYA